MQSDLHPTERSFIQASSLIALETGSQEGFDARMSFVTHTLAEFSHSFLSDILYILSKM